MGSTTRYTKIIGIAAATTLGAGLALIPASAAQAKPAKPDTACMQAGMSTLKSVGLFDYVAREGLPISAAVSFGVTPREGTDVGSLPDPLPLSVVLADHRAGESSLFQYPWCSWNND